MKRKYLKILIAFAVLLMFVISVNAIDAKSIYVSKKGSDSNKGTEAKPLKTIKKAVTKAKKGDVIYLKSGTYTGTGNRGITISKNIKISALSKNIKKHNAVINAGYKDRIFFVKKGKKLTIVGLKLTKGKKDYGGAVDAAKGKLLADNVIFTKNKATKNGGAVYVQKGSAVIKNSIFTYNSAKYGAGMATSDTTLSVSKSLFKNNVASISGGGLSHLGKKLTLTESNFTSNTAKDYGGGLHTSLGSHATIKSSKWTSNKGYGGGICNFGSMDISNSVFEKNHSPKNGGAIAAENNSNIDNCIFKANIANARGAGIHNAGNTVIKSSQFTDNYAKGGFGGAMDTHAPFKIYNSIIKNNKAQYGAAITMYRFTGPKEDYTYPSSVLVQGCTIQGNVGTSSGWGWSVFVAYGNLKGDSRKMNIKFVGNKWDNGVTNSLSGLQPKHLYQQDPNAIINIS